MTAGQATTLINTLDPEVYDIDMLLALVNQTESPDGEGREATATIQLVALVVSLQADNATLTTENGILTSDNATLNTNNDTLTAANAALNTNNDTLTAANAALTDDKLELEILVEDLSKKAEEVVAEQWRIAPVYPTVSSDGDDYSVVVPRFWFTDSTGAKVLYTAAELHCHAGIITELLTPDEDGNIPGSAILVLID